MRAFYSLSDFSVGCSVFFFLLRIFFFGSLVCTAVLFMVIIGFFSRLFVGV